MQLADRHLPRIIRSSTASQGWSSSPDGDRSQPARLAPTVSRRPSYVPTVYLRKTCACCLPCTSRHPRTPFASSLHANKPQLVCMEPQVRSLSARTHLQTGHFTHPATRASTSSTLATSCHQLFIEPQPSSPICLPVLRLAPITQKQRTALPTPAAPTPDPAMHWSIAYTPADHVMGVASPAFGFMALKSHPLEG